MVVIDTDVLIQFSKGDQKIIEKMQGIEKTDAIATTILNAEEFLFGLYFLQNENAISQGKLLLEKIKIYNYTMQELAKVVDLKVKLKKKGTPIGRYDEIIAGICLSKNEKLFTLNKKHFNQIDELKLID